MPEPQTKRQGRVRNWFYAGLQVFVPFILTLGITMAFLRWLDNMQPAFLWGGQRIPGAGILFVGLVVVLVGVFVKSFPGGWLVGQLEAVINRIPVASSLYAAFQQIVELATNPKNGQEQRVVLVQWPRKGVWSLAFSPGGALMERDDGVHMLNVFLPSTPNPTTGFFFMVPRDEVIFTDMSVEDGIRLLMSAGLAGGRMNVTVPESERGGVD